MIIDITPVGFEWLTGVAFLTGAACFYLAGYLGTLTSRKSGIRSTDIEKPRISEAITTLTGGVVSGLFILAFCMLGIVVIYFSSDGRYFFYTPFVYYISFAFGIGFAGILFELRRRLSRTVPAAGTGGGTALFEFCAAAGIGAILLNIFTGRDLYVITGEEIWLLFPAAIFCSGIFAFMLASIFIRRIYSGNPTNALYGGSLVVLCIYTIGLTAIIVFALGNEFAWLIGAGAAGLAGGILTVFIVKCRVSPANDTDKTIKGILRKATSLNITAVVFIIIGLCLAFAYWIGEQSVDHVGMNVFRWSAGGGMLGISVAMTGIAMSCPFILLMGDVAPVSGMGNTLRSLSKRLALIPVGAVAYMLFMDYVERINMLRGEREGLDLASIIKVEVMAGALAAVAVVVLFKLVAVNSKENKGAGITALIAKPGFRQTIVGIILITLPPVLLCLIFNEIPGYDAMQALWAYLLAATIGGILLASFMSAALFGWIVLLSLVF